MPADRSVSPCRTSMAAGRQAAQTVAAFLDGTRAAGLSHSELEDYLDKDGPDL